MQKRFYWSLIIVFLFTVVVFIINNINHNFEMNDFKVYYRAGNAIVNEGQLYGTLFALGSGYYKYSPFTALLFYPYCLIPYTLACIIHFVFMSAAMVITAWLLFKLVSGYIYNSTFKSYNQIIFLSFLCVIIHLVRELVVGNINVMLLLLLCLLLYSILKQKTILSGILLAIAVITKPFFVVLFIPLIAHKYYKTILYSFAAMPLLCILPSVFNGFGSDIDLHIQWIDAVFLHANSFPSTNMIYSILNTYFISLLNVSFQPDGSFQYIILAIVIMVYLIFIRENRKLADAGKAKPQYQFILEWFFLIALIPSLFTTDTEHFMMTWPLIIYIMAYLFTRKDKTIMVLFILFICLYDLNSSDLLGSNLSNKMDRLGILGISNLLIVGLAFWVYRKQTMSVVARQTTGN